MTTPATAADRKEPLRPLLARIWRDYLSHHRAALFLSMGCAAVVGLMAATVLQLLEPAIDGLFLGEAVTIWGVFTVPPGQALTAIPLIILGAGLTWTIAALGQAAERSIRGRLQGRGAAARGADLRHHPPPVGDEDHLARLHVTEVLAQAGLQLADSDGLHGGNVVS